MEKQYIATQTKSFTAGQKLADIIKGRKYTADRDGEWFIDEFEEKRYLPQAEFDEYFAEIRQKSYKVESKMRYATSGKNYPFYMVLFPSKDKDIIDRLEEMKETAEQKQALKGGRNGKSDYVRELIRKDIFGINLQDLLRYINNDKPIFICDTSTGQEFDGYDYEIPQEYLESTVKEFYVNDGGFICVDIAKNKGV